MPKVSAGIMMFRGRPEAIEVFLVHPGGPFWQRKDLGAWTMPKGEPLDGEALDVAARREFHEETGIEPAGDLHLLGEHRQPGGKLVTAFALRGEIDPSAVVSNQFQLEWPPRSGHIRSFPEVDRAAWFSIPQAREKILKGQLPFLERLEGLLAAHYRR
ncbi:NUDIX domain-containing protein [Mesorhizobium sp. KR2-14]|uniref:NUDIX domain-containing protein n=1 Tax=Mesorhizobium sp. KR2-14 TaxID=3156610 RepID=UPI0032B51A7D